jgi:hypothetical protein
VKKYQRPNRNWLSLRLFPKKITIGKGEVYIVKVKSKILFGILVSQLALSGQVFSASGTAITDKDAAEINELSEPEMSSSELVDEAIDAYFSKRSISEGEIGAGGKVYYRAVIRVSAKPSSPSWVKSRQIAFEKALLKAQSEYVYNNFGRNMVKAEQTIMQDNSDNAYEFDDTKVSRSQIGALYDKTMALGQAKLNELLDDAGVDPAEFEAIPEAQRKNIFTNSYLTTSIKKAIGESSGLLPVRTFEGNDSNGNHSIGVVMIRSDKLQQLASDMSRQREPFMTAKKGKPLSNYIDFPGEQLATQFGVRVVFNEQGKPQVLSYGQWGFGYKGKNEARLDRARTHSADKADAVAVDALTIFMNSRLAYENESTSGEMINNFIEKQGDEVTEEDVTTIIDQMNQKIKLTASAKLSGTRIVKRWKYKHPYGHEIIGRVRMWSMDAVEQSKAISSFKPKTKSNTGTANSEKGTQSYASGTQSGLNFDEEEEAF